MNGSSSGPKIVVLYKITNVKGEEGAYNAFELPGTLSGVSLASVKENCHALRHLSSAGASGYHWRVRVDDKGTNPKAPPKYSWWDIQDEAAKLPIKQVGFSELQNLLTRRRESESSQPLASKGVVRSLGKAMNKVAASVEGNNNTSTFDGGPRVPILIFKLLDVVKLHNEHKSAPAEHKRASAPPSYYGNAQTSSSANTHTTQTQRQTQQSVPTGRRQQAPQTQSQRHTPHTSSTSSNPAPVAPVGSLMDFGPGPSKPNAPHAHTSSAPKPRSNETRAQKLKKEYEKKNKTDNRVWDDVDQRWVTVEAKNGATVSRGTTSAPPGVASSSAAASKVKVKAVSLDQVNTVGKSAEVAAAVQTRVNDMKKSQEKAVAQIREREEAKKKSEEEEDLVRQKLEPKIKKWSEEHGKKKQLRALLASLHTVLWSDAKWKPVNLGDLLDDKKCRLAYHKASRVVHPDKTMKLPPDERFVAKRIFDALSQAKTEFDNK